MSYTLKSLDLRIMPKLSLVCDAIYLPFGLIHNLDLAIDLRPSQRPFVHATFVVSIGSVIGHFGIEPDELGRRRAWQVKDTQTIA
jgi:hypothetical protein